MDEPEDMNAFQPRDSVGAVFLLCITPAAMNYVLNDHDLIWTGLIAAVALLASVVVGALHYFTKWSFIGRLVNWMGVLLTSLYVLVLVYAWWPKDDEVLPAAEDEAEELQPADAAHAAPKPAP